MTTALIADDEEAPRQQLEVALAGAWPELRIVARACNGVDAWDQYLELEPDLCFLDIRMPGMTGLDVALRIDGASPVVFVTAFGDQAVAAFDAGAIDYVMKPVEAVRLARCVGRVQERLAGNAPNQAFADKLGKATGLLSGQMPGQPPLNVIQAGMGRETRLIPVEDVLYFESDSRYTRVVHSGGEALIRTPLKELLARLEPARFRQIHRSVIVQQRAIASAIRLDDGGMVVTLRDRPERLPVSRHFQNRFRGQ